MGFIDEIKRGLEPPKPPKNRVNPRSGFFEPSEKTIGTRIAEMEARAHSAQNAPTGTPVETPPNTQANRATSTTRGFWEWVGR